MNRDGYGVELFDPIQNGLNVQLVPPLGSAIAFRYFLLTFEPKYRDR
jgi:hypothetical protein